MLNLASKDGSFIDIYIERGAISSCTTIQVIYLGSNSRSNTSKYFIYYAMLMFTDVIFNLNNSTRFRCFTLLRCWCTMVVFFLPLLNSGCAIVMQILSGYGGIQRIVLQVSRLYSSILNKSILYNLLPHSTIAKSILASVAIQ